MAIAKEGYLMRETSAEVLVQRYATLDTPWGLNTYVNSTFSMVQNKGVRADIIKSPAALAGEWRDPTPYFATFSGADCILVDVESKVDWAGYTYRNIGKLGSNSTQPTIVVGPEELLAGLPTDSHVNQAVIKARNNVADRAASFAESFAEAKQTVQSLGAMAKSLDNFLVAASKKNWKQAARSIGVKPGSYQYRKTVRRLQGAAGTVGNAWLGFNFGIAPIISDMVSTCILLGGEWSFRVTGSTVLITSKGRTQVPQLGALGFQPGTVHWVLNQQINSGVQCRLDYELDSKLLAGFAKFGVSDVVQLGWALVPHSYLVDFVLPVSEVLKSLTATMGLTYKGGSATRFCQIDRSSTDCHFVPSGSRLVSATFLDARVKGRKMIRETFETEPNPIDLWIKDPLEVFPVATVLAVLGQRLSKIFPK